MGTTNRKFVISDRTRLADDIGQPSNDSERLKLVNSKATAGNATFTVVNSLSWPPKIDLSMRLCPPLSTDNFQQRDKTILEVSAINTGSESITVQTRGHQRFLVPWGPFQPEPDAIDDRMRIIDASPNKPPTSSLQIADSATGEVVRGNEQRGTGPLTDSNANRRPKPEELVTLKPGEPVVREVEIEALVDGLENGQYKITMQPRGCRWWHGEVKMEEDGGDGSVPAHLCPPLMFESQDEVELRIRDGKIL